MNKRSPILNKHDPFFSIAGNSSQWNACIGQQSAPESYVSGYMEASLELVHAVIEGKQYIKRDTLAMPILYNARHALELSLKYIHDALLEETILKNPHPQNHNIHSYWTLLSNTKLGDAELTQYIQNLKIFVVSLSNIDDDGQELRYAMNKDGEKSLQDKSVCNLVVIRESLLKLQKILLNTQYRLHEFINERKTQTYTNDLSRKDLEDISEILPPFNKWKDDIFDEKKKDIKEIYNIGSNKFSDALNLIKNHRTMASCLGKEFDLTHLTDDKIKSVIKEWQKIHSRQSHSDLGTNYSSRDFEAMLDDVKKSKYVIKNALKLLSADEIADLEALFYIGRDEMFCEFYDQTLARIKKQRRADKNLTEQVTHILNKTNLLESISKGLEILGKQTLAKELSQT